MSVRNLDALIRPASIALIGASDREHSVGFVTARNLFSGGFKGPIIPVNPNHKVIMGSATYPDVASMPLTPDLAVICTPPSTVPPLIAQLGARGTRAAIVITAGFREMGNDEGRKLEQAMLDAAKPHLLRVVGPNCLGLISTPIGLNASFAPENALPGGLALIAQSGAMVTTILDWATARGFGFSHLVSLGDMADVDFGDMLDYLANDTATTAILLYIEAVTQSRKFISAARAATRLKPVLAIKAGRHEAAAKAAMSHTGAMAGMDAVYDAAFRRAGILRVHDLDEIFDAITTLTALPKFARDDLLMVTNGGGAGVLAVDALLDQGGRLTQLAPNTLEQLNDVLPPNWSKSNPVDIIGDAPADRYAKALSIVLDAPETNAVLVLNCPTAISSSTESAEAVIDVASRKRKPILTNWLGSASATESRARFVAARIPTFETPTQAARGFMHLVRYWAGQRTILEVPSKTAINFSADSKQARVIVTQALAAGKSWLDPTEVGELLNCYRIPTAKSVVVKNAAEAKARAEEFATPVALKVVSPDIVHKSDVGGVAINLHGSTDIESAVTTMIAHIAKTAPTARITGFQVQEMIHRPGAYELIAGASVDQQFGPFLLFGQGGTAAEIIGDRAIGLPPLNSRLAHELIANTRVFRQLQGYRDQPPVALDAIADTLVRLSQLISDVDEVVDVELNPLLADTKGVITVDARVRVQFSEGNRRSARLAIRPYPTELEHIVTIPKFGTGKVRPIKPEDAPELARLFENLSAEDIRLRFFTPVRGIDSQTLARLSQIDYDREMVLVLETFTEYSKPADFLALVHIAADPDNLRAEFAIVVRSDLHHRGLGYLMMLELISYAKARNLSELSGTILTENAAMLTLCRKLGFALSMESSGVISAVLDLSAA